MMYESVLAEMFAVFCGSNLIRFHALANFIQPFSELLEFGAFSK